VTSPGPPYWLPPVLADESGLVGIGGDLEPDTLLAAYRAGVFPWFGEDDPILWFSPDPRGVIPLDAVRVSSRLARTIRSGRFSVTVNRRFREVMAACGENREDGTWVTAEMLDAYECLHRLGYAHSLEVWRGDVLAGGVYGVALGGLFAAESMFHRVTDASKVALVSLTDRLRAKGYTLVDIQMVTPHTATFGAVEIPRAEYLRRVGEAVAIRPSEFGVD
jgi:leucyl/phenylalanyl-tRNA--protein transferase